tara:strand:+ start:2732 stop:3142 length:411 start_codon:yes stop_codon:yes gene_type:complete
MNKNKALKILNVEDINDKDKIKSEYKKLALKWHPDRNSDNKEVAENKFKEISEAYQYLMDDKNRMMDGGISADELFNNFFGRNVGEMDIFNEMFEKMSMINNMNNVELDINKNGINGFQEIRRNNNGVYTRVVFFS